MLLFSESSKIQRCALFSNCVGAKLLKLEEVQFLPEGTMLKSEIGQGLRIVFKYFILTSPND